MDNQRTEGQESCQRVDDGDAGIDAQSKEAEALRGMLDAVKEYAVVMDGCMDEAAQLVPKIEPVQGYRFEARIRVALALYDRATGITQKPDVEKYLDRLINWYEAKDSAPGESPEPIPPPPFYATVKAHTSPTERLANLFLDFLESRIGAIFGEAEDPDERANEGRNDAPGT